MLSRRCIFNVNSRVIIQVPVQGLGAVFAAGAYVVPSWQAGLGPNSNIGGLTAAVLSPVGGFGKFLVVLLVLTIPSATNPTMYTVCTSFMAISPVFAKLPRFVIALLAVAVYVRKPSLLWVKTNELLFHADACLSRSWVHQGSTLHCRRFLVCHPIFDSPTECSSLNQASLDTGLLPGPQSSLRNTSCFDAAAGMRMTSCTPGTNQLSSRLDMRLYSPL